MKLGIGTVQFGLDYGISNQEGITSEEEVKKILEVAVQNGIRIIDTASLYGTSEQVLGKSLYSNHGFSIVTKTPKFLKTKISAEDVASLEETFHQSLSKMGQSTIYGLLIHHADDLFKENGNLLMERMQELKYRGLVKKVGVSVYTCDRIDRVLEKYSIDLIQLPINVLDQRLLSSGYLSMLKRADVEVHARSVFLQGLLLLDIDNLPNYFDSVRKHLRDYQDFIRQQGLTMVQAALGFVTGLKEVDVVVCGVNNYKQLLEICSSAKPLPVQNFARFALTDENILNPSLWRF